MLTWQPTLDARMRDSASAKPKKILEVMTRVVFGMDSLDSVVSVSSDLPVTIVSVTDEDVDRVVDFRDESRVGAFRRFLTRGDRGVYAWLDGQVVAHAWAFVPDRDERRFHNYIRVRAGEALIHDCQVREDLRGHGIYPSMVATMCRQLFQDNGTKRVLIDTDPGNAAALSGIRRVGFRPVGLLRSLRAGGRLLFQTMSRSAAEVVPR